jgi:ribosomal protein S18 acetylase RimI-like enzyme
VTAPFHLEALESHHDRSTFASGKERLDHYFQTQVTQDIRRRIANCFVAVEVETRQVVAYYTIASASVSTPDLPSEDAKRLPRYPTMPAVRIGRLAVDRRYQGRGLGKALLADAAMKVVAAAPASFALLVDAKDDQAASFYKHHGFRPLGSLSNVLFLPLATAEKILLA